MALEENIKKWISLDDRSKELLNELKSIREKKNETNLAIFNELENKNINNPTIKINNNLLKISKINHFSPLSLKYIESCLNKFIDDKESLKEVINFIKINRPSKSITELKRTTL